MLVGGGVSSVKSQSNEVVTITVTEHQSVRDIAKEYLNNPNLWMDILRANGLSSPHEIQPGMTLQIPARTIFQANQELDDSLALIQQATGAGAKIFAPEIVADAIAARNTALERRKSGDWSECISFARTAADKANQAIKISKENQDVPADAVVQYCHGQVQNRKAGGDLWKDVSQYDILVEGDRVRTLSQSFADILFRDDSRLQLKENAQALIQKVRTNLLEDTQKTNVSLIEGDVLALLAAGEKTDRFKLEVPGVKTKINSQRFWVSHDAQATRFANYDGELGISSAGAEVLLKKNQGSIVPLNQKPTTPRKLLAGPLLHEPENGAELITGKTAFTWSVVAGAESYLVEFAQDASFSRILKSEVVEGTIFPPPRDLSRGTFFWRVTAVASDGLPGLHSVPKFFLVMQDVVPPFLALQTPKEGATVTENSVLIAGNTEEDALLVIQDQVVDLLPGGNFQFRYLLSEGENEITAKATDRSGNPTKVVRKVYCISATGLELTFGSNLYPGAHNHFLVGSRNFSLNGKTAPQATVTLTKIADWYCANGDNSGGGRRILSRTDEVAPSSVADDSGRFQFNVKMAGGKGEFRIDVVSRTGASRQSDFIVELDSEPPIINFTGEVPSSTANETLSLAGMIDGGVRLELNGQSVALRDVEASALKAFQVPVELVPGKNRLHFEASDHVGNIAVLEKEITRDSDAPEFVNHELSLEKAHGGEEVRVVVRAKDMTGLVKAAPFMVDIGGSHVINGHMLLSESEEGIYSSFFHVPKNIDGVIMLKSVTLSDYLGNSKTYEFK